LVDVDVPFCSMGVYVDVSMDKSNDILHFRQQMGDA